MGKDFLREKDSVPVADEGTRKDITKERKKEGKEKLRVTESRRCKVYSV